MTDENLDNSTPEAGADDVTDEQLFQEFADAETDTLEDEPAIEDEAEDFTDESDQTPDADDAGTDDEPDVTPTSEDDAGDADDEPKDIWEGASPEARKAFDDAQLRERRSNGTVSGMQKQLNDMKAQLASVPSDEDGSDEADADELKRVAAEYPEVAAPLITQMQKMQDQLDTNSQQTREAVHGRQNEKYEEQHDVFLETHADGFDVVTEDLNKFEAWVDDQPRATRNAYENNKLEMTDAKSAIQLVADYKVFLDPTSGAETNDGGAPNQKPELTPRRRRQLAGAKTVKQSGSNAASTGSPAAESEDQGHWNDFQRRDELKERANNR